MDQLFFEIHVFLFDVIQFSGIFYEVLIDGTRIFPLHLLIVLFVVLEILRLQGLHDTLQVPLLCIDNFLLWQTLGWNVSIVEVDTNVSVFHFKVTGDSWISDDFLVLLLAGLIDLVAIEHGIWGDIA